MEKDGWEGLREKVEGIVKGSCEDRGDKKDKDKEWRGKENVMGKVRNCRGEGESDEGKEEFKG